MTEPPLRRQVAARIAELALGEWSAVVVHGGGPFIKAALEREGVESRFVRGLRVTEGADLAVIEPVLTQLSKILAQEIGNAVGLTGRDAHLLVARVFDDALGLVGEIAEVNRGVLERFLSIPLTPVIACIAENEAGDGALNVNADSVAGSVAGVFAAPVVFLSDVPGVLDDPQDPASVLATLRATEIEARIADGRLAGGMIPKVEAALEALTRGAAFAVIADGRNPESLHAALQGRAGTRVDA